MGHATEIATMDVSGDPGVQEAPCKVHPLGPPLGRNHFSWKYTEWLARNARLYDAVIIHGLWNYSSVGAWFALSPQRIPYVLYLHGSLDPYFGRSQPIKGVLKQLYFRALEGKVVRDAARVLFTSKEELALARQTQPRLPWRAEVVAYGAEKPGGEHAAQTAAFFHAMPALKGRKFFLFLGRIHPKKGCDILIQAFARVAEIDPDIELAVIGPDDTNWRPELIKLATRLGLRERIHWHDMLSGDAKWGAYRNATAFVLPSHSENFGIVVAEAMACETPVLITDKVNIWPQVAGDGAGLVSADSTLDFAESLRRFILLTPAERTAMGKAAGASFTKNFDAERAARHLETILDEVREEGRLAT